MIPVYPCLNVMFFKFLYINKVFFPRVCFLMIYLTLPGKCHLLTSSKITNNIAISNTNVSSEQKVKLLGINLESRLNFDYHMNTLLNKANKNTML